MNRLIKGLAALVLAFAPTMVLTAPAQAATSTWTKVSAGYAHTCGIRTNQALYCWGHNGFGQLGDGDGDLTNRTRPRHIGTSSWLSVSAGTFTTCGIRTNRALYCWGANQDGQIGDGTTTPRLTPRHIGTGTWLAVATTNHHACGITVSKKLYCWGGNSGAQLGTGDTDPHITPTRVGTKSDWTSLTVGGYHTCAINDGRKLYCWGYNNSGQLGDGTTDQRFVPERVGAGSDWTKVTSGNYHTCGLRYGGRAFCWGDNFEGQLGDESKSQHLKPTGFGSQFDPWSTIAAGEFHTCAVRTNHMLYCWGANGDGQLGTDETGSRSTPGREDRGYSDWTTVQAGSIHTCALRTNKTLYCWGDNHYGQLGVDDTNPRTTPTRVP